MKIVASKIVDEIWKNLLDKIRFEVDDLLVSEILDDIVINGSLYLIRGNLKATLY
jgi:hypothetical protein